jgi:hypothetical protein
VMEAEVRELEAWAKTQEAIRLLRDIADNHRNTKAAEAANAAIQLLENRHAAVRAVGTVPVLGPVWQPLAPVQQLEPKFQRDDPAPVPARRREIEVPRPRQREEQPKQPVSRLD